MIKKILFVVFVLLVAFSCIRDTQEVQNPYAGLVIKTGTICGWCTVNDTLTINLN